MGEKNLPHFGVGPYLVLIIGIITIFSSIFSYYHLIPIYEINELNMVFFILGIILIILGIIFWIHALMISKIHSEIENNNLITTGIYSHVRHPIYAAFLYVSGHGLCHCGPDHRFPGGGSRKNDEPQLLGAFGHGHPYIAALHRVALAV